MPLPRNLTKERMLAGKPCLGVGVFFGSPTFVEMLAYAGFRGYFAPELLIGFANHLAC